MIEVEYDGKYPNTCSGRLTIKVDGVIIYSEEYRCHSTGSVWFDKDWSEHVESGKLKWEDEKEFDRNIVRAVRKKLKQFDVCCGGCV